MGPDKNPRQTTMAQLAPLMGMGVTLAAAMVMFGGLGWWLDGKLGTGPWLLAVGCLVGAGGGMISLIRTALRVRKSEPEKGGPGEMDETNPPA